MSLPLSSEKYVFYQIALWQQIIQETTNIFNLGWLIDWIGVKGGSDGNIILYSLELKSRA